MILNQTLFHFNLPYIVKRLSQINLECRYCEQDLFIFFQCVKRTHSNHFRPAELLIHIKERIL